MSGDQVDRGSKSGESAPRLHSPRYAWYALTVLFIAYIFSFVDRLVLSLVVDPLKADLDISDTQVSLLQGISFALLYTILGIPAGRLVDRFSRRKIILFGILTWSLMATLCGIARSYTQLIFARMGVGVGEATLSPAAYSLLADYFAPRELARAYSIYGLGITIGTGLAYALGSWIIAVVQASGPFNLPIIGELAAWQMVLVLTGLPGLPIALLVLTIREPVREPIPPHIGEASESAIPFLLQNRSLFGLHFSGFASLSLFTYGLFSWAPSLLSRTFNIDAQGVGLGLGAITGIGGSFGLIYAGRISDRLFSAGRLNAPIIIACWVSVGLAILGLLSPQAPSLPLMWIGLAATFLLACCWSGIAAAALSLVTPSRFRGQVAAFYLFSINLVGLGLGPTAVALVTDGIFQDPQSIRHSLSIVLFATGLLAAFLFYKLRTVFLNALKEQGVHSQSGGHASSDNRD